MMPQKYNIIAGNRSNGVVINGYGDGSTPCGGSGSNLIANSIIGTDPNGDADLGNDGDGIAINDSPYNTIATNKIGGNGGNGIHIAGSDASENQVVGNEIGWFTGAAARPNRTSGFGVPNGQAGLLIETAVGTAVGGTGNGQGNIISGNNGPGVSINLGFNTVVANNYIGTDGAGTGNAGNGGDGVVLSNQSASNQIGNSDPNSGNHIAFNGGNGVWIDETAGA